MYVFVHKSEKLSSNYRQYSSYQELWLIHTFFTHMTELKVHRYSAMFSTIFPKLVLLRTDTCLGYKQTM